MIEVRTFRGERPDVRVVVVIVDHEGRMSDAARALDEASGGRVGRAIGLGAKLEHGDTIDVVAPKEGLDRAVVLVLGKPAGIERLQIEEAGASLAVRLKALKVSRAVVASCKGLDLDEDDVAAALASGAMLRSYDFDTYKSAGDEAKPKLERLDFETIAEDALDRATGVARGVARTRDLVSEPANVLYPESFAERCRDLEALGIEVEILGPEALAELKMGALLGVGQGSVRPPCVVVMRWRGGDASPAEAQAPLALVGKGVCFDTGGISIKPAAGMEEMKWDMGGAGAVVGAMHAIAARRSGAHVVGVIGLAENMPSGTAQRPGDVVTSMSGTTIEVINTDAEGRLLLADVLHYTRERFAPSAIVDLATLTGAVIVALGHENAGLFANRDELAQQLTEAGAAVGEGLWRLPLGAAYDKHIKSQIADIKNVGRAREAGATAGAVFLQRFVGETPWAHLDIAGTAWTSRDLPLAGKGATGFGVRLLDRFVADHWENGPQPSRSEA